MKRYILIILVIIVLTILSGCAFLLNNIISGAGTLMYTAHLYFNGLPANVLKEITGESAKSINTNLIYEINLFFDSNEYKVPMELSQLNNIFNGLRTQPYSFAAPQRSSLDMYAKFTLSYSTDTTNPVPLTKIIEFPKSTYELKNNEFYVIFNFTQDATEVKVLEKAKVYKYEIQTNSRDFISISDATNDYKLLTENVSGIYRCIFIAERGKTYTFRAVESGVIETRTPQDDKEGEVVYLTPKG